MPADYPLFQPQVRPNAPPDVPDFAGNFAKSAMAGYQAGRIFAGIPQQEDELKIATLRAQLANMPIQQQLLIAQTLKDFAPGIVPANQAPDNRPMFSAEGQDGASSATLANAAPQGAVEATAPQIQSRLVSDLTGGADRYPDAMPINLPGMGPVNFSPTREYETQMMKLTMPWMIAQRKAELGVEGKKELIDYANKNKGTQEFIEGPNGEQKTVTLLPGESLPEGWHKFVPAGFTKVVEPDGTVTLVRTKGADAGQSITATAPTGAPLKTDTPGASIGNLQKTVQANQEVQTFNKMQEAKSLFDSAMADAQKNNDKIASDRSIIEGFNRISNPRMGLRPSMYLSTPNEQGLWNKIAGAIAKNPGGQGGIGLTDEDRAAFGRIIQNAFDAQAQLALQAINPQIETAKARGHPMEQIVPKNLLERMAPEFSDEAAVEAANPPDGTLVRVGGRLAKWKHQ